MALDVERLSAILRRVTADPKRSEKEKKEIARHLKRAMTLILQRSGKVSKDHSNGVRA